ncbi:ABC transporter permease subunit [Clostridium sp. MCC353]|uniref:ABC transporter permease n=1 Tax=Clostridium sp. MCC353 TaxID=2592646 RepID=UPI001C00A48F|nr:ABC transporter permease subunit [Clostridium sp. MCC353]MBT9778774.1 ABC transporter permease subunit [Clostridium sp. MCC353]
MKRSNNSAAAAGQDFRAVAGRKVKIWKKSIIRSRYLLLMISVPFVYLLIFHYQPIYGLQIAFKDFNPFIGMKDSPWVGFAHFVDFFHSEYFFRLIKNTLVISLVNLAFTFPLPIIIALTINEITHKHFKKTVQTIIYLPHFISSVVVAGLVLSTLSLKTGTVNQMLSSLGMEQIDFMNISGLFPFIVAGADVWQGTGWASIIYLAAMTGVDPALYEAAVMDGASKWKQVLNITIPSIMPTIIIQFILKVGQLFNVSFQKILLLYNPRIYDTADVISTYVYRRGLMGQEYSFGAAVGLFNTLVNLTMLLTFNYICKKTSENSLW